MHDVETQHGWGKSVVDPYFAAPASTVVEPRGASGYAWLVAGLGVVFGGIALVAARANPDSLAPWLWLLFPVAFIGGDTIRTRRRRRS